MPVPNRGGFSELTCSSAACLLLTTMIRVTIFLLSPSISHVWGLFYLVLSMLTFDYVSFARMRQTVSCPTTREHESSVVTALPLRRCVRAGRVVMLWCRLGTKREAGRNKVGFDTN